MTPRERLLRTMRGERADRVPLVLPAFQRRLRADVEAIEEPLRRQVAERAWERMHYSVGVGAPINRYLVTPPQRMHGEREDLPNGRRRHNGVIDTPKGELTFITEWNAESPQTSWTIKYPCETLEDIAKIASVPWERAPSLQPPKLDELPADFAERGIVRTGVSSPFVCVAGMMRYERFLELVAMELPLIEELTAICLERILDCLEVLFSEPGIEYVWMGGSEWVTPPMASPRIYDRLVQEQERAIIEYVHGHSDAVVHVHCHGNIRDALPKTIARGGDYTEPCEPPPDGDITMAEAKAVSAGQITLGGNVEARVLCNEDEATVERAVRAAFEGGKERLVLRPSEGASPHLSEREFRNYMRLIDVWEELSPMG